jgi:predicted permease
MRTSLILRGGLAADVRFGGRMMRRSPGFTIAAVASVSIGVAATTAAFSTINALVFRSMPGVRESGRLVHIYPGGHPRAAAEADYARIRESLTTLSSVAAFARTVAAVDAGGNPLVARVVFTSDNYFEVLGARTAAGQLLDSATAHEPAAVVGYGYALQHFGSAERAVERSISVNGQSIRITGVAGPGFVGPRPGDLGDDRSEQPQIWMPLAMRDSVEPQRDRIRAERRSVELIGRLARGAAIENVQQQAASLLFRLDSSKPATQALIRPLGVGPNDTAVDAALAVSLIMAVPLIVLAIGCANTANLLIARASQRESEIAVRLALGATRRRVARQLLVESLLVALVAGAVGLTGAIVLTSIFEGLIPVPVPLDWRVLGFALIATTATGLGFGAAPALAAARHSVTLKDTGIASPRRRTRLRNALVVAQIALSLFLLVLGGLFTRSLGVLQAMDAGRRLSQVAAATFNLDLLQYTPQQGRTFQADLLGRIEQLPGVVSAAIAPVEPFGGDRVVSFRRASSSSTEMSSTSGRAALGRFLETAGIPVVRGRGFSEDEVRQNEPAVAIISQALADRLFPDADAVGQTLVVSATEGSALHAVAIIGIAANVRQRPFSRGQRALQTIYLPAPLQYESAFALWLRTSGDPRQVLPDVRALVKQLDSRVPVLDAAPLDTWRERRMAPLPWIATGVAAMGMLAMVLAAGGLHAIVSYIVASRRQEVAIRLALGATRSQLMTLVIRQGLRLTLYGTAAGLLLAGLAAYLGRALLVGMSPFDPIAFGGFSLMLAIVALLSTLAPAIRASRIDPLATLRRQ